MSDLKSLIDGGDAAPPAQQLPGKVEAYMVNDGDRSNVKPESIDTHRGNYLGETFDSENKEWKMASASQEDLANAVTETSNRSRKVHDAAMLKAMVQRDKVDSAAKEASSLLNAAVEAVSRIEPWSAEQEEALAEAVNSHGGKFTESINPRQMAAAMDWTGVSEMVPGKTKAQCSERWILYHTAESESDKTSESIPSALLTAASEAAATAAGVLLAAAHSAEEERRARIEEGPSLRLTTPVEARKETVAAESGPEENLMEYNALVHDALGAKRKSVEELQAKVSTRAIPTTM